MGSDWLRLFSAGTVSMIGDGMMIAALPLVAATLTSKPGQIAAVAASAGLPWLLLSLPAGSLVDRWDRRRLMIGAQSAQMVIISTVALLALTGLAQIWLLFVAAFALVSAELRSSGAPARPSAGRGRSPAPGDATGRQQASIFLGEQSLGPPLGVALFAVAVSLPFVLNAASFAISILLIVAMRPRPAFRPRIARQSAMQGVADVIRSFAGTW